MSASIVMFFDSAVFKRLQQLFIVVLCCTILSCMLVWIVREMRYFQLQRVVVKGDVLHNTPLTLKTNVSDDISGYYFGLNLLQIKHAFENTPWIRKAVVHRGFPNKLLVFLEEHQPAALWRGDSDMNYVNNFGELFQANAQESADEDLPILKGADNQASRVMSMFIALRPMTQRLDAAIVEIELRKGGSWRMQLQGGPNVELGQGSETELQKKLQNFSAAYLLMLNADKAVWDIKSLETVDLRYPKGFSMKLRNVHTAVVLS